MTYKSPSNHELSSTMRFIELIRDLLPITIHTNRREEKYTDKLYFTGFQLRQIRALVSTSHESHFITSV